MPHEHPGPAPTLTRKDIQSAVAKQLGIADYKAARPVAATLEQISEALAYNQRVEIRGLGVFESRWQESRVSMDPRTGRQFLSRGKWVIVFKPSKTLKSKGTAMSHEITFPTGKHARRFAAMALEKVRGSRVSCNGNRVTVGESPSMSQVLEMANAELSNVEFSRSAEFSEEEPHADQSVTEMEAYFPDLKNADRACATLKQAGCRVWRMNKDARRMKFAGPRQAILKVMGDCEGSPANEDVNEDVSMAEDDFLPPYQQSSGPPLLKGRKGHVEVQTHLPNQAVDLYTLLIRQGHDAQQRGQWVTVVNITENAWDAVLSSEVYTKQFTTDKTKSLIPVPTILKHRGRWNYDMGAHATPSHYDTEEARSASTGQLFRQVIVDAGTLGGAAYLMGKLASWGVRTATQEGNVVAVGISKLLDSALRDAVSGIRAKFRMWGKPQPGTPVAPPIPVGPTVAAPQTPVQQAAPAPNPTAAPIKAAPIKAKRAAPKKSAPPPVVIKTPDPVLPKWLAGKAQSVPPRVKPKGPIVKPPKGGLGYLPKVKRGPGIFSDDESIEAALPVALVGRAAGTAAARYAPAVLSFLRQETARAVIWILAANGIAAAAQGIQRVVIKRDDVDRALEVLKNHGVQLRRDEIGLSHGPSGESLPSMRERPGEKQFFFTNREDAESFSMAVMTRIAPMIGNEYPYIARGSIKLDGSEFTVIVQPNPKIRPDWSAITRLAAQMRGARGKDMSHGAEMAAPPATPYEATVKFPTRAAADKFVEMFGGTPDVKMRPVGKDMMTLWVYSQYKSIVEDAVKKFHGAATYAGSKTPERNVSKPGGGPLRMESWYFQFGRTGGVAKRLEKLGFAVSVQGNRLYLANDGRDMRRAYDLINEFGGLRDPAKDQGAKQPLTEEQQLQEQVSSLTNQLRSAQRTEKVKKITRETGLGRRAPGDPILTQEVSKEQAPPEVGMAVIRNGRVGEIEAVRENGMVAVAWWYFDPVKKTWSKLAPQWRHTSEVGKTYKDKSGFIQYGRPKERVAEVLKTPVAKKNLQGPAPAPKLLQPKPPAKKPPKTPVTQAEKQQLLQESTATQQELNKRLKKLPKTSSATEPYTPGSTLPAPFTPNQATWTDRSAQQTLQTQAETDKILLRKREQERKKKAAAEKKAKKGYGIQERAGEVTPSDPSQGIFSHEFAEYPWNKCTADMERHYGSAESARKICGKIKANRGKVEAALPGGVGGGIVGGYVGGLPGAAIGGYLGSKYEDKLHPLEEGEKDRSLMIPAAVLGWILGKRIKAMRAGKLPQGATKVTVVGPRKPPPPGAEPIPPSRIPPPKGPGGSPAMRALNPYGYMPQQVAPLPKPVYRGKIPARRMGMSSAAEMGAKGRMIGGLTGGTIGSVAGGTLGGSLGGIPGAIAGGIAGRIGGAAIGAPIGDRTQNYIKKRKKKRAAAQVVVAPPVKQVDPFEKSINAAFSPL